MISAPVKIVGQSDYYRMADIFDAMQGSNLLNLDQERAKVAREQAREKQRKNDIEEKRAIPVDAVIDMQQQVAK